MARRVEKTGDGAILYDDLLLSQPTPALFDRAHWPQAQPVSGHGGGRGATLFLRHGDQDWAWRHYRRGGLIGRLLDDQFLWLGAARTRSFREWLLLAELLAWGLPVPRPVAAAWWRSGAIYRADLVTLRLPGVRPFPALLAAGEAGRREWQAVGDCIGRFHARGVWHADLNAYNIQLDGRGRVFLLDFDRGRRRLPATGWQRANLARLHRSLVKLRAGEASGFGAREWDWLLEGHARGLAARRPVQP